MPRKASGTPVTLISHELSLSGAPKLVADLACCLSQHGYAPRVLSFQDGPMRKELEKHGIPVHVLVQRPGMIGFCRWMMTLFFHVRGKVIVNSMVNWRSALLLSWMRPWQKTIWYIHEPFSPLFGVGSDIRRRISSFLINKTKKLGALSLWFGSAATHKTWFYSPFSDGQVMYWSGIPVHREQKPKSSLKRLLSVGTASSRKGTKTLVEAFLLCLRENRIPKDVTLTIVGFSDSTSPFFDFLTDIILKVATSEYKRSYPDG